MSQLVAGRLVLLALLLLGACASGGPGRQAAETDAGGGETAVLHVGAIPDQDPQELQRRYGEFAGYLSETLRVETEYVPVTDYTAAVTAFRRGDLDLVFFGGLTGVQARLQVPGAAPIAQRDIDAEFHSVFIASTATGIGPIPDVAGLQAVAGRRLTFGSESSTSGRLMPQFFLAEAGVGLDEFTGQVGFSDSHDTTVKLVEAGTYEVGALNAAVWDERMAAGEVDTGMVAEVFRTPPYHDYHWLIRPDVDERFGDGFTRQVTDALLALDGGDERERAILDLFQAGAFIETTAENYETIEAVARGAGLIEQ